jgi:nucleotide-binding universal stress UspA family protein
MLRKLLIAVDDSPSSDEARRLAVALARQRGARLRGIAVIDTPWITRPMAVGIGGTAYKVQTELEQLRSAHRRSERALAALAAAAAEAGVACEGAQKGGDPAETIEAEATTSDLLVLGREASFYGREGDEVSAAALGLLARNPRPLLLAPSRPFGDAGRMLVAFDGSAPSSRSLHMLALLGLAVGRQALVLTVAEEKAAAEARAAAAAELLRLHGVERVDVAAVASEADPADIIIGQVQAAGAGIVAMGAYGHRGLREMVFGSCTRRLLGHCPAALFVHH